MLRRAETFNFGSGKPPAPRNIAAPFQREDPNHNGHLVTKEVQQKDFIDFTNFNFVALEEESLVTFEKVSLMIDFLIETNIRYIFTFIISIVGLPLRATGLFLVFY